MIPNEEMLAIGAIEGALPLETLIRAAFLASGVSGNELDKYVNNTLEIRDSLNFRTTLDMVSRGEALLKWMHENLLTRYEELQTSLVVLLEKGTYNCVSSAVLYMLLARSIGIPVHGVLTKDHAFCRIPVATGGIDVETTTIYGFDAGSRKLARDTFTSRTGFTYVPTGKQRRDIGEKEFVALILQNRVSMLQKSGNWEETVGLSLDRWALTKSQAAMEEYRLSVRNYAIYLNEQGRQVQGLFFLDDAARTLGKNHRLEDIASTLLGNAIVLNLRKNRIEEARMILEEEKLNALVSRDFLAARRREMMRRELEITVQSVRDESSFRAALDDADKALAADIIDIRRWEELVVFLWTKEAQRKSIGGNWMIGWLFLETAPEVTRAISGWNNLEAVYEYNTIITYHNRFAAAMKQRRVDTARTILNEGLELFPDSSILIADKELLMKRP